MLCSPLRSPFIAPLGILPPVNKVLRCQDALEVFGIEIDKYKDRTNRTLITIKTNEEYCQQSGISDEWLKEYNS